MKTGKTVIHSGKIHEDHGKLDVKFAHLGRLPGVLCVE